MRIESSVTSVTWIPSEAIKGMPKMPFEMGIAHYDEPPPDVIEDIDALRERDAFREANMLKAWIDVDGAGRITDYGHEGRGLIGVTRMKIGPKTMAFPAVKFPIIQPEPEVGEGWVRFVQTAGGRMGLPAPRRVRGKPFFQVSSASAWTTLQLIIYADGTAKGALTGASPFPRHWIYDHEGRLVEKSGTIDFEKWYRESYGENTPWGGEDTPAFVTAVESELEREISWTAMRGEKLKRRRIEEGATLVEQGEEGNDMYLLLDGVLEVEVDGDPVAQLGPGAVVGEMAALGGGARTATLRASTPVRVAVLDSETFDERALAELAATPRRRLTHAVRGETRYAKSGDVNIAYRVVGDGPFDIVWVPGAVSNVELLWDDGRGAALPRMQSSFFDRIASFSRLILFDKRGTGASDRVAGHRRPRDAHGRRARRHGRRRLRARGGGRRVRGRADEHPLRRDVSRADGGARRLRLDAPLRARARTGPGAEPPMSATPRGGGMGANVGDAGVGEPSSCQRPECEPTRRRVAAAWRHGSA